MSQWSGVRARLVVAGTSELVPGWRLNFISRGRPAFKGDPGHNIPPLLYILYLWPGTVQCSAGGSIWSSPERTGSYFFNCSTRCIYIEICVLGTPEHDFRGSIREPTCPIYIISDGGGFFTNWSLDPQEARHGHAKPHHKLAWRKPQAKI